MHCIMMFLLLVFTQLIKTTIQTSRPHMLQLNNIHLYACFWFRFLLFTYVCVCVLINREIYKQFRASYNAKEDVHTRLMKKYRDIPSWWFHLVLVVSIILSLALCIFKKDEIQMPWWGLLFAAGLALVFTLPVSVITATTNQARLLTSSTPNQLCLNFEAYIQSIVMYLSFVNRMEQGL